MALNIHPIDNRIVGSIVLNLLTVTCKTCDQNDELWMDNLVSLKVFKVGIIIGAKSDKDFHNSSYNLKHKWHWVSA